jgi:fatty-acyl-CoA synthase
VGQADARPTIGDAFDQTVARFPDRDALIVRYQGLRCLLRRCASRVDRCAGNLMALGIKGQRADLGPTARSGPFCR